MPVSGTQGSYQLQNGRMSKFTLRGNRVELLGNTVDYADFKQAKLLFQLRCQQQGGRKRTQPFLGKSQHQRAVVKLSRDIRLNVLGAEPA